MKKIRSRQTGFTLLELVASILIIGILASITAPLLYRTITAAHLTYDQQTLNSQGRLTLELMAKDIRNLSTNTADSFSATANSIEITDLNGQVVHYYLNANNLIRSENGVLSTLQTHVSSLVFSYYDINGNLTSTLSDIRYVRIAFTLTHNSQSETFETTVFLRNAS